MNNETYIPAEGFPPGEYLKDELEAREWTQIDLAKIIDRPPRTISDIINNKRGISTETAMDFAAAFGTSADLWLNLETNYQLFKASQKERSERDEIITRKSKLYDKFPVSQLVKSGWIEASESFEVLEARLFSYYRISDIGENPSLNFAPKKSDRQSQASELQLAWLYKCANLAKSISLPNYSETKLRNNLEKLETLMSSAEEIRHVPSILAECGVRLVIVEPWKGSKICGVCFWLDNNAPVIGMTLLFDRIDNFWFVLRHEIEHVLRGDGKNGAIIDEKGDSHQEFSSNADDDAEDAANNAASNFCVPETEMTKFIARLNPVFEEKNVLGLAKRIDRHPGIVVGQLQKRINRWNIFRSHLVKVREVITKTALTQGYGVSAT